jgi:hypothetical protein
LTLLAAAKKANAEFARFVDAHAFDNDPRSPTKIAEKKFKKLLTKSSTDVKTTLRAVSSALTTLDAELSATPRDADLYCSYTVVFYIATFSKSCLVLLPCIN